MQVSRTSNASYPSTSNSGSSIFQFERRKRKKFKSKYGAQPTHHTPSFQKKLVVFKFMGDNPPRSFVKKDNIILLRGLLPEISLDASEYEIRSEILSILQNCEEFQFTSFCRNDFHFIDVNGKQANLPLLKDSQEFNGRCVKQLAGQGAVYIRLTKPFENVQSDDSLSDDLLSKHQRNKCSDSDSSFELPPVDMTLLNKPKQHNQVFVESMTVTSDVLSSVSQLDTSIQLDTSVPSTSRYVPIQTNTSIPTTSVQLDTSVPSTSRYVPTQTITSIPTTSVQLDTSVPSTSRYVPTQTNTSIPTTSVQLDTTFTSELHETLEGD